MCLLHGSYVGMDNSLSELLLCCQLQEHELRFCTEGHCALCTEGLRTSELDPSISSTQGRYTRALLPQAPAGSLVEPGMCQQVQAVVRCLLVVQCFWDSSTLGPMCLVPRWGLALVFLLDGAQALEERSYRYWEGGCVVTF